MPDRMSDRVAPYRTPLDLYMYLNDLTSEQVEKDTGVRACTVRALRCGRFTSHKVLRQIEQAYQLPPGSLGSYASVFRMHPFLWYRVELPVGDSVTRCRYCGKRIVGVDVTVTMPYKVRIRPHHFHYPCFLKAWEEIRSGVESALDALASRSEEVRYEREGWRTGSVETGREEHPTDQHRDE